MAQDHLPGRAACQGIALQADGHASGVAAEHQYRFSITNSGVGSDKPGGDFERIDPYARDVETSDAGAPGYITQPSFAFGPFRTPRWENFLLYQMHIGSFAGLNDGL